MYAHFVVVLSCLPFWKPSAWSEPAAPGIWSSVHWQIVCVKTTRGMFMGLSHQEKQVIEAVNYYAYQGKSYGCAPVGTSEGIYVYNSKTALNSTFIQ